MESSLHASMAFGTEDQFFMRANHQLEAFGRMLIITGHLRQLDQGLMVAELGQVEKLAATKQEVVPQVLE